MILQPVTIVSAALLSPADRNTIQQQQQQLLNENQRQREELERSVTLPETATPNTPARTEGPCFMISRIDIDGATKLSTAASAKLIAPWVNQCLDIPRLTELTNAISDWYISRGYITSRAFLTEQDLSSGVLHIAVLEDSPTQGGHLYPGNPGKTVFPQRWSADKVVHTVGDIATSPDTKWFAQTGTGGTYTNAGRPARWVAWEEREGVRVRVVYEPASGKIVTAFPDNNPTPPALKPIKK